MPDGILDLGNGGLEAQKACTGGQHVGHPQLDAVGNGKKADQHRCLVAPRKGDQSQDDDDPQGHQLHQGADQPLRTARRMKTKLIFDDRRRKRRRS
ncbi:hypothetical protein ACFSYD_22665 [Paracoccus aerius]